MAMVTAGDELTGRQGMVMAMAKSWASACRDKDDGDGDGDGDGDAPARWVGGKKEERRNKRGWRGEGLMIWLFFFFLVVRSSLRWLALGWYAFLHFTLFFFPTQRIQGMMCGRRNGGSQTNAIVWWWWWCVCLHFASDGGACIKG